MEAHLKQAPLLLQPVALQLRHACCRCRPNLQIGSVLGSCPEALQPSRYNMLS